MASTFDRRLRLCSRKEFAAVQEHGRRVASRYLTVLASGNDLGRDRLGIIASRRLGGAVVRNRAKRRLREVFRRRREDRASPDRTLDIVAIPRRDLTTAPFPAVEAEFGRAISRLRRMKTP